MGTKNVSQLLSQMLDQPKGNIEDESSGDITQSILVDLDELFECL